MSRGITPLISRPFGADIRQLLSPRGTIANRRVIYCSDPLPAVFTRITGDFKRKTILERAICNPREGGTGGDAGGGLGSVGGRENGADT